MLNSSLRVRKCLVIFLQNMKNQFAPFIEGKRQIVNILRFFFQ